MNKFFRTLLPPSLLFLATFALFAPSIRYAFIHFDDPTFIVNNPIVFNGFSWSSVGQAFTALHGDKAMYTPLLWISYLLDTLFFRASPFSPAGFHLGNVLLHAANSVLLFFILKTAIRRPWLAFAAAAFWAFHPLRAESVAWITERKDTLSTLFAFASILCYLQSFRPPGGPGAQPPPSTCHSSLVTRRCDKGLQCLALVAFVAGLLSKPMLVTLPFLFLLLDYWPLGRFSLRDAPRALLRLVLEKWPWFLLVLLFALLTYRLQTDAITELPLRTRLLRLPPNYFFYLSRSVWPAGLCLLSPGIPATSLWFFVSGAVLLLLAAAAIRLFRIIPGFAVGLLAFAGLLFPVSGIVFIGAAPVADRYSYLPSLGLSLALLSLLAAAGRRLRPSRVCILHSALCIVLAALAAVTARILPAWKNTESISARAERVFPGHLFALQYRFVEAAYTQGDTAAAQKAADAIWEKEPCALFSTLAEVLALSQSDSSAAALAFFESHPLLQDRKEDPAHGTLQSTLAILHADTGNFAKAESLLADAMDNPACLPQIYDSLNALAFWLCDVQGLPGRAAGFARRVSSMDSSDLAAPSNYLLPYTAMWNLGLRRQALPRLLQLANRADGNPALLNNIAWLLATAPNSPASSGEVLSIARRAFDLAPDHPVIRDTFAVALAYDGQFDQAVAVESSLVDTLRTPGSSFTNLLPKIENRIWLFRARTPFTENADVRILFAR